MIVTAEFNISDADYSIISVDHLTEFSGTWNAVTQAGYQSDLTLPFKEEGMKAGEPFIISTKLPDEIDENDMLFFRASHQYVKIMIDHQEAAAFGYQERHLFGKTPGCSWMILPISSEQAGKELQLEVVGAYDKYAGKINEVYLGEKHLSLPTF